MLTGESLWVFDLAERRQVSSGTVRPYPPGRYPPGGLWDVACAQLDGRLVAVTGGYDGNVRIWDVAAGKQLGDPLCGHDGVVRSVACGVLNGHPIAVTGGADETVRLWDLDHREQMGQSLCGHDGEVGAVIYGWADGRPIVASGGKEDGVLRLWELDDPDRPGIKLFTDSERMEAVALARVAGRDMLVSGGTDVRVWDLSSYCQAGPPLFDGRDIGWVSAWRAAPVRAPIGAGANVDGAVRVGPGRTPQHRCQRADPVGGRAARQLDRPGQRRRVRPHPPAHRRGGRPVRPRRLRRHRADSLRAPAGPARHPRHRRRPCRVRLRRRGHRGTPAQDAARARTPRCGSTTTSAS